MGPIARIVAFAGTVAVAVFGIALFAELAIGNQRPLPIVQIALAAFASVLPGLVPFLVIALTERARLPRLERERVPPARALR